MISNNRFIKSVTGLLLTANLLSPLAASAAVEGVMQKPTTGAAPTGGVCTRIAEQGAGLAKDLSSMRAKLGEARSERDARVESRKKDIAAKLTDIRKSQDAKREEIAAKLAATATTDAQKQAIAAFKAAVSAAQKTRRAAIDAANKTFDAGVKDAILKRKAAADAAVKTFNDAMNAAIAKAKADCAAGVDPTTIRTDFMAAVKAAKDKLKTDRAAAEKVGPAVQPLIEARRTAFEKALADFKAAMEKARADLKAAFPEEPEDGGNTNSAQE